MRYRTLRILWPSFLMAGVLEGLVFSVVDPAAACGERWSERISAPGVYTLAFLAFWAVVAAASAMTAVLVVEPPDEPSS